LSITLTAGFIGGPAIIPAEKHRPWARFPTCISLIWLRLGQVEICTCRA